MLTYRLVPLIRRLVNAIDHIDTESKKKATLLSFLYVFMQYKEQFLKDNQYMILSAMASSQNSHILFVGKEGREDLELYIKEMKQQYLNFMNNDKTMAEIDLPPEM